MSDTLLRFSLPAVRVHVRQQGLITVVEVTTLAAGRVQLVVNEEIGEGPVDPLPLPEQRPATPDLQEPTPEPAAAQGSRGEEVVVPELYDLGYLPPPRPGPAPAGLVLRLARGLRGGAAWNEARVRRAWNSGHYASLVVQGVRERVPPTPQWPGIPGNCVYVVVQSPIIERPAVVRSWAACRQLLPAAPLGSSGGGRPDDRFAGSVFHAWPSLAEAEAYAAGAGLDWPLRPPV